MEYVKRARLHEHTDYSLNDSAMSFNELIERAKELGVTTLAKTDHGTMQGYYAFYKACLKAGINPVLGFEAYVDLGLIKENGEPYRNHMILLAKDDIGMNYLYALETAAHRNLVGRNNYPVLTIDMIKSIVLEQGHVVATSACLQGPGAFMLQDELEIAARETGSGKHLAEMCILTLVSIFGIDDFFIELQNHGIDMEAKIMPELVKIANKFEIGIIAADDAHFARKTEDDVLRRQISQANGYKTWFLIDETDTNLYMHSDEELIECLSEIIDEEDAKRAVETLNSLGDKFSFRFPDKKPAHYPRFFPEDPTGKKAFDRLTELANLGHKRYDVWTDELQERQDYELSVMKQMDVIDYQLMVEENNRMASYYGCFDCKEDVLALGEDRFDAAFLEQYIADNQLIGVGKGPGRGSAAGSLVCYTTGITDVEPTKFGLLFERFLNPSRVSMPKLLGI